jgi:hypothetical protein
LYDSIRSTSQFHSAGILVVEEFTLQKTEVDPGLSKYENHPRLLSDHQS